MTENKFLQRKTETLNQLSASINDKSPKGSVDQPIAKCIEIINRHPEYFTTSSCSGRVAVFCEGSRGGKARDGYWLFVSHDPISVSTADLHSQLQQKIQQPTDSCTFDDRYIYFKFEPMILHVECASVDAAQRLYSCVYQLGFRNSGISIAKCKFVVAIRSSLKLDAPIAVNGKWIVEHDPQSLLEHLVRIANAKFDQNFAKLRELESALEVLLTLE